MKRPSLAYRVRLFVFIIALASQGCASKFNTIHMKSFDYANAQIIGDSIRVSYAPYVQALTGNKRYAAKETAKGMMSVAVKIENLSSRSIDLLPTNFEVHTSTGKKDILSADDYAKKIKQRVALHLLHALWGPWSYSHQEDTFKGESTSFIYIPVGLIVGIGNAVRARNANNANLDAHQQKSILNKTINPGEIIYGLMPIQISGNELLKFSYNSSTTK